MNISLTPTLEELVNSKVQSGHYNNASEVVREDLRLLSRQDEEYQAKLSRLKAEIDPALEALDRGEYNTRSLDDIEVDILRRNQRQEHS
ncbi:MAG: type II toxin-antitoxin system ParD family antitoxin [Verrucomicrobiota bacterium]